ncbi:15664_t:CDS:10 [Entrophospora sp. SA101]|nr:15664_t:CDS:10 [Entrophospora sp. SA101]
MCLQFARNWCFKNEKVVAEIVAQLRGKTIRAPDISYTSKEIDCQLDAQQNWSFKGDPFTPTLLLKLETFQVIQRWLIDPENKEIHIYRRDRCHIKHGWKDVDNVDFFTKSNNNVHIPTNKEIEDTINYGEVKNTTHNTRFWLKVLTSVRTKMGYNYDINKSPYAPTSIKNCFAAAIHKYLQENSKISPALDLYDECMFPRLHKHLDGKIKKMQDLSIIKQKKSDSLEYDEIYQILTHPELNKGTPLSTTYKTYFWLCFLCGFCGGDAQRLKLANKRINDQLKTRILEIVGHPVNLFDLDKNGKLIPMPQSSYSREKVVAEIVAQLRGKTIRAPDIAYAPKEIDCQLDAQQNWSLKVILSPLYLLSKSETFQVIQNPENKEIHIDRRDRRRINHGWKEVDNVDFLLMFTLVIWKIKHVISQRESISPEPSSFSCNSCSETFTDPYVMITHVEDKHAYKRRH